MDEMVDLSTFSTGDFSRGGGRFKDLCWLVVSQLLFDLCPLELSAFKATANCALVVGPKKSSLLDRMLLRALMVKR
jgi:hypothetical protein